jgi:hypothetical protein
MMIHVVKVVYNSAQEKLLKLYSGDCMTRFSKFTVLVLGGLVMLTVMFSCSQGASQQNTVSVSSVLVTQPAVMTFNIPSGSGTASAQSLSIINKGAGSISWVIGDNSPWITIQQAANNNGSQQTGVIVVVDAQNLSAGDYTGVVTITSEGALNSPVYVPVYLTVSGSTEQKPQVAAPPAAPAVSTTSNPPADTAAVWKNKTEFYSYGEIRSCIVSGSLANIDRIWYMGDARIITTSGAVANIASAIPPGEQVIYYRYIPSYGNEDVRLDYHWYRP